ncbi:hypothetical protein QBC35DRAFT_550629 [Podospora australis]|uniref:Uncharacterized protein n=1 Tax=Podospora australis TaxID=1536484 RepID=A0AAN6WUV8_9PEZI|nr:hypothetical protein QBC35DRAFT_550629 [Podospora australis]
MTFSRKGSGRRPDWVWSPDSNVHDRQWFTTYTPFKTAFRPDDSLGPRSTLADVQVLGIGDVEIPLRIRPKKNSRPPPRGRPRPPIHAVLQLRPSMIAAQGPDVVLSVHASWPEEERQRWFRAQRQQRSQAPTPGSVVESNGSTNSRRAKKTRKSRDTKPVTAASGPTGGSGGSKTSAPTHDIDAPEYTQEERGWLKKSWGNEYKDEHREEGRRMVRSIMEDDTAPSTRPPSRARKNSAPTIARSSTDTKPSASPLEEPSYTAEEKKWLKVNWKNEYNFLRAHGMTVYTRADWEAGRRLVRSIMSDVD